MSKFTKTLVLVPETTLQYWGVVKPSLALCALVLWRWM